MQTDGKMENVAGNVPELAPSNGMNRVALPFELIFNFPGISDTLLGYYPLFFSTSAMIGSNKRSKSTLSEADEFYRHVQT